MSVALNQILQGHRFINLKSSVSSTLKQRYFLTVNDEILTTHQPGPMGPL